MYLCTCVVYMYVFVLCVEVFAQVCAAGCCASPVRHTHTHTHLSLYLARLQVRPELPEQLREFLESDEFNRNCMQSFDAADANHNGKKHETERERERESPLEQLKHHHRRG